MKYIYRIMMLPLLMLPLLLTSCDDDRDCNPILDLSHVGEGFVLNTPAFAQNNTYDLNHSEGVRLTCSQPNYGEGVPYSTRYFVQFSLDNTFAEGNKEAKTIELPTSYLTASMLVNGREFNDAIVDEYLAANPTETKMPYSVPVYVRLRACLNGTQAENLGETFSNVITLPSVHAEYQAPDVQFPENLFVVGSSIQTAWSDWKEVPPVFGLAGKYYTMVYLPAKGSFKWGTYKMDWRGFDRITIDDQANASAAADDDGNIQLANGGWYALLFEGEMSADKKSIAYTLHIYPGEAYVIGNACGGAFNDADPAWAMKAPADQTGMWESPAFTTAGDLRAYIHIPGIDWWRTEFTIFNGKCYWRNVDIPDDWATNVGAAYSVACSPGQKLYVNFDNNDAEVK